MNNMLEQKIRNHAGEIFGNEPAAGHRERFAGKLAAGKNQKQLLIPWYKLSGYVAAAVVLISVVLVWQWNMQRDEIQEDLLVDVRNYYTMQLDNEVATLKQLLQEVDANESDKLWKDIEAIREEPVQEENISLVVRVYDLKIETLQHIHHVLTNSIQSI
jgi:hypothetical protein